MPKKLIRNGTKIISMAAHGVTIKDSLSFLPMALEAIPKAFELEELAKGFFPYLFDTPENADYDGEWPDAKFYDPDRMKAAKRKSFLQWYEQQRKEA